MVSEQRVFLVSDLYRAAAVLYIKCQPIFSVKPQLGLCGILVV